MERMKPGKPRSFSIRASRESPKKLKEKVIWFLCFLNENIESLNKGDFIKLLYNFQVFLAGRQSDEFITQDTPYWRNVIKLSQDYLQKKLKNILDIERTARENGGAEFRLFPFSIGVGTVPGEVDHYSIPYQVWIGPNKVIKLRKISTFPLRVDTYPITGGKLDHATGLDRDFVALLNDATFDLLEKFSPADIKICQKPGCKNYYYQKSKKPMNYCSPKCSNWARQEKYRKKNRKKYNAYHKNRRKKEKEDQVEVKCRSCGYQESKGFLGDYLKSYSDPEDCPRCKNTKLLYIIKKWYRNEWEEWGPYGSGDVEWIQEVDAFKTQKERR